MKRARSDDAPENALPTAGVTFSNHDGEVWLSSTQKVPDAVVEQSEMLRALRSTPGKAQRQVPFSHCELQHWMDLHNGSGSNAVHHMDCEWDFDISKLRVADFVGDAGSANSAVARIAGRCEQSKQSWATGSGMRVQVALHQSIVTALLAHMPDGAQLSLPFDVHSVGDMQAFANHRIYPDCFRQICGQLPRVRDLVAVDIRNQAVGDAGLELLCAGLAAAPLTLLDVHGNEASEVGMCAVIQLLHGLQKLRHRDVSGNAIDDSGCVHALADALARLPALSHLQLGARIGCRPALQRALAVLSQLQVLQPGGIDHAMWPNPEPHHTAALADALPRMQHLRHLDLSEALYHHFGEDRTTSLDVSKLTACTALCKLVLGLALEMPPALWASMHTASWQRLQHLETRTERRSAWDSEAWARKAWREGFGWAGLAALPLTHLLFTSDAVGCHPGIGPEARRTVLHAVSDAVKMLTRLQGLHISELRASSCETSQCLLGACNQLTCLRSLTVPVHIAAQALPDLPRLQRLALWISGLPASEQRSLDAAENAYQWMQPALKRLSSLTALSVIHACADDEDVSARAYLPYDVVITLYSLTQLHFHGIRLTEDFAEAAVVPNSGSALTKLSFQRCSVGYSSIVDAMQLQGIIHARLEVKVTDADDLPVDKYDCARVCASFTQVMGTGAATLRLIDLRGTDMTSVHAKDVAGAVSTFKQPCRVLMPAQLHSVSTVQSGQAIITQSDSTAATQTAITAELRRWHKQCAEFNARQGGKHLCVPTCIRE